HDPFLPKPLVFLGPDICRSCHHQCRFVFYDLSPELRSGRFFVGHSLSPKTFRTSCILMRTSILLALDEPSAGRQQSPRLGKAFTLLVAVEMAGIRIGL